MAMYLNRVPVYIIMLLGQWSSDAFLCYICKQVPEFSNNVSCMMIKKKKYHHVSDPSRDDPQSHNRLVATANIDVGTSSMTINCSVLSV